MVYTDEGHAPGERVGLGGRQYDQQRSNETRTARQRDPVNFRFERVQSGLEEGPMNHRSDRGDVGATGEFGHDPAKGPVLVDRGLDDRGKYVELLVDDGRRRLVTTRLDPED